MIFHATAIGKIAQEILEKRKSFYVHSIFKKGFNIVSEKQELIFVGSDENGTFPFGIVIDQQTKAQLLKVIDKGQTIKLGPNAIYLNASCQLVWQVEQLPINDWNSTTHIKQFECNIKHYDFSEYHQTDFDYEKMKKFMHLLEYENGETVETYYRHIIGRGQGLTPSGDDILTGMLFVHFIHPYITNRNLEILAHILEKPLTTLVGETFLKCAQKGQFSSKISVLQQDPSLYHMNQLLEVGSTSGKDTLYGMYVALTLRSETYG